MRALPTAEARMARAILHRRGNRFECICALAAHTIFANGAKAKEAT